MKRVRASIIGLLMFALAIGLVLVLGFAASPASAQSSCSELEILFVVDQSGSMGGNAGHPTPNDPKGLRFAAQQEAVKLLGSLRYKSHPTSVIRIARVDFGERAEVGLGWRVISPTNEIEWNQQYKVIEPALVAGRWAKENLGGTDFARALQEGDKLFKQLVPQVGDCPYRSLILLTDGHPDVPDLNLGNYFKDLEDFRKKNFPAPNYDLYVVALNDSADNYWPTTQPHWLKVAGDASLISQVNAPEDIAPRFQEILVPQANKLPGIPGDLQQICPGDVTIQPFLQSVAFTLFKVDARDHLLVQDELGRVDSNRKDITVKLDGFDGPIETIEVVRPFPGRWIVKPTILPHTKCDIQKLNISAAARLTAPRASSGPFVQFSRVNLGVEVTDSQGVALPDYDPRYALDTKARVVNNIGVQDVNVAPAGKNTYTAAFVPVETGAHQVEVVAQSQDLAGKPMMVVNQVIPDIIQIVPPKIKLIDGPSGAPLPDRVPISITVAAFNPADNLVRLDAPVIVTATIATLTQTISLAFNPAADGTYNAMFTPRGAGTYRLSYQAAITVGSTRRVLGGGEMQFTVEPAIILQTRLVKPTEETFEATNLLGMSNPFEAQFQVVDENNRIVDLAQVLEGNPQDAVNIRVVDSRGQDRTGEIQVAFVEASKIFRAEARALGADKYTFQIVPSAKTKRGYAWGASLWSHKFTGNANPWFYAVLFLAILLGVDVVQWAIHWGLDRTGPPLRGWVYIAQMSPGATATEVVWKERLPRAHFARFSNGWGWRGLIPWHWRYFKPKLNIRKIEASAEQNDYVRIKVWTNRGNKEFQMRCQEGLGGGKEIGYGFIVYVECPSRLISNQGGV